MLRVDGGDAGEGERRPAGQQRMYSLPGLPLTDVAATAGLKTFRAAYLRLPERARWSPIVRAGLERVAEPRPLTA